MLAVLLFAFMFSACAGREVGGGGSSGFIGSVSIADFSQTQIAAARHAFSGTPLPNPEATGGTYLGASGQLAFSTANAFVTGLGNSDDPQYVQFFADNEWDSLTNEVADTFCSISVSTRNSDPDYQNASCSFAGGVITENYDYAEPRLGGTKEWVSMEEQLEIINDVLHKRTLRDGGFYSRSEYEVIVTGDNTYEYTRTNYDNHDNKVGDPEEGLQTAPVEAISTTVNRDLRVWFFSPSQNQSDAQTIQTSVNESVRDDYDTNPVEGGMQGITVTQVETDDRSTYRARGTSEVLEPDVGGFIYEARYAGFGIWNYDPDDENKFLDASQSFFYGLVTPDSSVPTSGTATYQGFARGAYKERRFGGGLDLEADFGAGTISGEGMLTQDDDGTVTATLEMDGDISGNVFSGETRITNATGNIRNKFSINAGGMRFFPYRGSLDGGFFGPDVEEAAGKFSVLDAGNDATFHGAFIGVKD